MGDKANVLIVEDEYVMSRALSFLCNREGFEARTAKDGAEAIDEIETRYPTVLILDLDLPRINGFEVCRRVRDDPDGDGVHIIALTASPQDEDRRRILELGANEFMTKPFDPIELIGRIRTILAAA